MTVQVGIGFLPMLKLKMVEGLHCIVSLLTTLVIRTLLVISSNT
jgi:hypothetical protein